jgi:hypothetical protein
MAPQPSSQDEAPATTGPDLNGVFLRPYRARRRGRTIGRKARGDGPDIGAGVPGRILQAARGSVPEVILDESNLLPFDFLRTGDQVGRAVLKIERADGAAGTGFLIAPGILLTNHHVLPDAATAASARAHANYEETPPDDAAGRTAAVPLEPSKLFVTNEELDFTFCGVSGLDFLGSVPLRRDSLNILPAEYVNIIQHPRGRPKQVALQDSQVVKVDSVVVQYCCDTEPGSSGSPVFNNRWHLVALHHASVVADGRRGRRVAGAPPEMRFLNEGIRLSAIALWLESAEANRPELRGHVARIRAAFADLDRQAGYFGALGRRAGRRSAAELVVEAYHDTAEGIDLAFWDLTDLGDLPEVTLQALGCVVAEMGLDVWCLRHPDPDTPRRLSEHLDAHYRLDYRPSLPREPAEAGHGLALLHRHRPSRAVAWLDAGPGRSPRLLIDGPGGSSRGLKLVVVPVLRELRDPSPARLGLGRSSGQPDADLVLIGDGLRTRAMRALARIGPDLRAAIGREGGLAIVPAPHSRLGPVFVSPNLDRTLGPPDTLHVADDRRWPAALETLANPPIAARLNLRRNSRTHG